MGCFITGCLLFVRLNAVFSGDNSSGQVCSFPVHLCPKVCLGFNCASVFLVAKRLLFSVKVMGNNCLLLLRSLRCRSQKKPSG